MLNGDDEKDDEINTCLVFNTYNVICYNDKKKYTEE